MTISKPTSVIPFCFLSQAGEEVYELASHQDSHFGSQFLYTSVPSGTFKTPSDITQNMAFKPAIVPGTITQLTENTINAANLDGQDHWLQTQFDVVLDNNIAYFLQFDGLLTHADVFLNGTLILQSYNAFHTHIVDIGNLLRVKNQLYICFRAIAHFLAQKQPRARFPTRLINQRHLRFIRTPTLGYMPGFASEAKLVGAFRPIKLITQTQFIPQLMRVNTVLVTDTVGQVSVKLHLKYLNKAPQIAFIELLDEISQAEIFRHEVNIDIKDNLVAIEANFNINNIEAYWPHTHGTPKRYLLKLMLSVGNLAHQILLGKIGFRHITYAKPNNFALQINQTSVFMRGACWTPINPLSLQTSVTDLRQRLQYLQQVGINMLRLPGNMPYECDDFYELCDELGILIMQDFAFTNFDYPEDNAEFVESVKREATTFLAKHGNRACLTLLAGNSEVAQQAAMLGITLNNIQNTIFDAVIKNICAELAPNVPYVNSSPNAQHMPFHADYASNIKVDFSTSHYYGVGGYKRRYEDARLFKGQFIAECLAFSHVPENSSLLNFYDNEFMPSHHPRWKEGVPRDNGAGWDFADITDFYVAQLFGVNVANLRATDPTRYLDYCRATSCELVERTMSILRADSAQGRAALVWYLHDLKPGAGWGYIDSLGVPKSAFYGLARASQPTTLLYVDEGLEGLAVYVAHDGAHKQDYFLEIALITADGKKLEQQIKPLQLTARASIRISIDAFLGRFVDSSYAYRFGPRSFVACVAKLSDLQGNIICQKVYVEPILTHAIVNDSAISACFILQKSGEYQLKLSASQPIYFAVIDIPNAVLSDNYLHIMPNYDTQITIKTKQKPLGRVRAFNMANSIAISHQ